MQSGADEHPHLQQQRRRRATGAGTVGFRPLAGTLPRHHKYGPQINLARKGITITERKATLDLGQAMLKF